jgi:hypothetical protein
MRRLAAATLSLAWVAVFAAFSVFALFAAEDGAPAAAKVFGLPVAPEDIAGIASRPAFAGFSLGAAVVAALFATVAVSSFLNASEGSGRDMLVADMGFGGAIGLSVLAFLPAYMHSAPGLAVAMVAVSALIVVSLLIMRSLLAVRPAGVDAPVAIRRIALGAAAAVAANANVVRFPVERATGVR